jgi:NAD(P)-dependent dehydrogenase (short-subunit alcohol dehydrogenase family)
MRLPEDGAVGERVAIVSGAAGGIGAAIAQRLDRDGFAVASCDVAETNQSSRHVVVDVTDRSAVSAFVDRVRTEIGPPDVVVTAAGVQCTGASEAYRPEDWRRVIEVNLTGTWNLIQSVLPTMVTRRSGRIITISSEIGLAGAANYAAYAASKGGVIALTKALAREFAPVGICVNSVAPGPIETGMLLNEAAYDPAWLDAHVPIARWGRVSDVAATVALLAGDDGGYYVGQILSPNGGTVI